MGQNPIPELLILIYLFWGGAGGMEDIWLPFISKQGGVTRRIVGITFKKDNCVF